MRKRNWEPVDKGDHFLIPLTMDRFALIDKEDLNKVIAESWQFIPCYNIDKNNGYARCRNKLKNPRHILMHRWVSGYEQVDHINGNRLDNRKCNLRECTTSQNGFNIGPKKNNKSGFKGVSWSKQNKGWVAFIGFEGRNIHLGTFNTPEEASDAYLSKARELQGEFFPSQRVA